LVHAVPAQLHDAGLFSIPSGYSQTTMQELMQGGHQ
jgi:hypothetical protein